MWWTKSDGADIAVEWEFENAADAEGLVTVEFEPTDVPALERVANRFSQTEPPRNITVLGMVTLLSRPTVGAAGVVRLEVLEGSQAKKLRVRMPEVLYDEAIRAHREGMALQMSGRQEKEGRLYWLYDPTEMLLVEPPLLPDPPASASEDDDDDYLA